MRDKLIYNGGVDEAGRGPCIGPLVIGCVIATPVQEEKLKSLGVKDSKQLSPHQRESLIIHIQQYSVACSTLVISPEQLNFMHYHDRLTLNEIETRGFSQILNEISPKPMLIFLDAADVNENRFGHEIQQQLLFSCDKIISKHKGDSLFTIVGAASILAKVRRDQIVESYTVEYPNIGSGYPSDPITIQFLESYYRLHKSFPPFVRTWWKTIEHIQSRTQQNKLTKYMH